MMVCGMILLYAWLIVVFLFVVVRVFFIAEVVRMFVDVILFV